MEGGAAVCDDSLREGREGEGEDEYLHPSFLPQSQLQDNLHKYNSGS